VTARLEHPRASKFQAGQFGSRRTCARGSGFRKGEK
jgi:hypothetical protein